MLFLQISSFKKISLRPNALIAFRLAVCNGVNMYVMQNAEKNGTGVIIAAAGKAAHLAGAIAGQTPLPVIGIPIKASALEGIDALLSTVQMPAGVPVATVAIDGAANAAFLAVQILAVSDDALMEKMKAYRAAQTAKVLEADKKMEQVLAEL